MEALEPEPEDNVMTIHINCSPYREDGFYHIRRDEDYRVVECHDCDENATQMEEKLSKWLDEGHIHSYYIKRHSEPEPKFYD